MSVLAHWTNSMVRNVHRRLSRTCRNRVGEAETTTHTEREGGMGGGGGGGRAKARASRPRRGW
eukprot:COSAG03_NODE_11821_length_574_cov_13.943158_1_plen_62_part_10